MGIVMISSENPVSRLRTNSTRLPSGEKDGPQSSDKGGGSVSLRTLPSARLSRMIFAPPEKARVFPSGDHATSPRPGVMPPVFSFFSALAVNLPSDSRFKEMVLIWNSLSSNRENAKVWPSGAHAGQQSPEFF